jgi:hypothetical protein
MLDESEFDLIVNLLAGQYEEVEEKDTDPEDRKAATGFLDGIFVKLNTEDRLG